MPSSLFSFFVYCNCSVVRKAFISSSDTLTKYLTKAEDDAVQRTLLPFLSIPSQQSLSTVVFGFAFKKSLHFLISQIKLTERAQLFSTVVTN